MKKIISILFCSMLVLTGCGNKTEDNGKLNIVTTVYPVYDIVYQIAGDDVNVTNIYPPGADIHEYELTSKDMAKIADSDMFIYISDESTPFVADLKASGNYNTKFISIMDSDIYKEAFKEDEHDHDHEGEDHDHDHDEHSHDPHIWLSPKRNIVMVDVILNELVKIAPDKKDEYTANADKLKVELKDLDAQYTAFGASQTKDIYVAHDAYQYVNEDYNTKITGAYGTHHDDEPSAQEIAATVDSINSQGIKYVYVEQNDLENGIIKQISRETKAQVLVLNNLATVSKEEINSHVSFTKILGDNLAAMEKIND